MRGDEVGFSFSELSQFLDKIATERPPKAQSLEGTDFLVRAMKTLGVDFLRSYL